MKSIQTTEHFGGTVVAYTITLSAEAIEVMKAYDRFSKLRRLDDERRWFDHPGNQELQDAGLAEFDPASEGEYFFTHLSERGRKVLAELKKTW